METGPIPPILPSEVRSAINRLKRDKAPEEDNITDGIVQDGGEPIVKILTKLFNGIRSPQLLEERIGNHHP